MTSVPSSIYRSMLRISLKKARAVAKFLHNEWIDMTHWINTIEKIFTSQNYKDNDDYDVIIWVKKKLTEINNTLNKLKKEYKWV